MLLGFTTLAILMTFAGGLLPLSPLLFSRRGMSRLFSARAGILLAVSFTEILPAALGRHQALGGWAALCAFAFLFVMGHFLMLDSCPEYLEQCRVHYLGFAALVALFAHSFIDGFNLGVSFSAGSRAGIAVGLALALHKVADGFTLTSLLQDSGYDRSRSLWALVGVASATPLGSLLSKLGLLGLSAGPEAAWLGFAAGSFIYIAAADVLPRLHKNQDRGQLAFFGLGLFGMAALRLL